MNYDNFNLNSKPQKKIVHIVNTLSFGGVENLVINMCNLINKDKYIVYLIILTKDKNEQIQKVHNDVNVIIFPFLEKDISGISSYRFLCKGIPYLSKTLMEISPDVIHTHAGLHRLLFVFLGIRASKIKCKCFHTIHMIGYYYTPDNFYKKIKLCIEKKVLKILKPYLVAISPMVEENCRKLLSGCYKELRCICNGVIITRFEKEKNQEIRKFFNVNEDEILLVYVARLSMGKGHLVLFQAMEKIKQKNIKLLVIGDGELRQYLKRYADQALLNDRVIFTGSTDKVPDILAVCDIGIFPSEHEGFSIALLEMMASGLPIICTDIPVFKFIFKGSNGALFFDINNFDLLASHIKILCKSKELRLERGKIAKQIALNYTLEDTIKKHELYYGI